MGDALLQIFDKGWPVQFQALSLLAHREHSNVNRGFAIAAKFVHLSITAIKTVRHTLTHIFICRQSQKLF